MVIDQLAEVVGLIKGPKVMATELDEDDGGFVLANIRYVVRNKIVELDKS